MRRTLALWLLLFAAYAATIGLTPSGTRTTAATSRTTCWPPSRSSRTATWTSSTSTPSARTPTSIRTSCAATGTTTEGRLNEPHGVGFPLFIAPAYALGGATGVELFLAAIAALAMALAYRLALRVAPDPWALGAALAVGLSPPFLAYGTAVYPELTAGAALAGAALLALRLRERVTRPDAFACFALLGALPWLGTKFVAAGVVIGAVAVRALWRAQRRTLAVGAVELSLFSRGALRGDQRGALRRPHSLRRRRRGRERHRRELTGRLPRARLPAGGPVHRPRVRAAALGARVRARLRRALVAVALASRAAGAGACPECARSSSSAALCAAALGAQLVVAAFVAPTMFGFWFPPRHLLAGLPLAVPLVASGLRHVPRLGQRARRAHGGRIGAGSTPTCAGATASLVTARPDAPFGPLTDLLPAVRARRRLAVLAGGRGRCGRAAAGPARGARGAPLAPDGGRHAREVLGVAHERASARATPVADRNLDRRRCRRPRARA